LTDRCHLTTATVVTRRHRLPHGNRLRLLRHPRREGL